tara:strand:+ start:1457 stop:2437 length:981 start_codon:yes stop_codon:yes gene_type:complete
LDIVLIVSGFVLLILGGEWLLKSAVGFANYFDIPKIIIGLTVVSFATSAPELFVSIRSIFDGYSDLAIYNVIGSNIANLGFVLSITLIISVIRIRKSFIWDWAFMIFSTLLFFVFIFPDKTISRIEGVAFLFFLILFIVFLYIKKDSHQDKSTGSEIELVEDEKSKKTSFLFLKLNILMAYFIYFSLGSLFLWIGSEFLICGTINIAEYFGVSQRIIAITMVSIGTSIPELTASLMAALKNEKSISLGNLIGSNIFNIMAVLGISSIIRPIKIVDQQLLNVDAVWMICISIIILPLVYFRVKMTLSRVEGFILLLFYLAFIFSVFS